MLATVCWLTIGFKSDRWMTLSIFSQKPKEVSEPKAVDILKDPVTGMEFVWVAGGSFDMGSPESETGHRNDEKLHRVELDGFWMGKYEVTVEQYMHFVRDGGQYPKWLGAEKKDNLNTEPDDSYKKYGTALTSKNYPIVGVSWDNASAYAKWLSAKTGKDFRLPSEAQWEYGCRGGKKTARFWGDNPSDACKYANVDDETHKCKNGNKYTAPVGSYQPNPYGLYDMLGNVWEWVEDVYLSDIYSSTVQKNPVFNSGGARRVIRGGSWGFGPGGVRCAYRDNSSPADRDVLVGFRLIRKS